MGAISFKCPNCGGELIFDPSAQNYKCEYCATAFSQQQLDQMESRKEQDMNEEQPRQSDAGADSDFGDEGWERASMYSCPSCGAEIVADSTTAATFCYYCHNPVVLAGRVSGNFRPDQVIPFSIDRKNAEERFFTYIKKKKFVPKDFYGDSQIEKMTGVYYPYWLYGNETEGYLKGEGVQVRSWRTGDTEFTERKYYDVRRSGKIRIDHLTRNALQKANKELVENVQPYDLSKATTFSMGYLSGFVAEKRDIGQQDFSEELRQETHKYAKQILKGTAKGYSSFSVQNEQFDIADEKWNYTLFPVWVLTYKSSGKIYYFAMNGQTGNIAGKLPIAKGKLMLWAGAFGAAAAILGLIGGYLI